MPGNSGGYAIVAKNMSIISIENLSKRYLVGHQSAERERYTALRDVIARKFKSVLRNGRDMMLGRQMIQGDEIEEFWALRDVSFEVERGDVVGIIGRNGAGKSTLLKILSRITEPTSGRITLRGRVASLLEVGTGFHPELTGRENIFLNGAILGMSRSEIKRKFDEIVDFAEVSRFLDTPVKRYSSGMYVRLAFSVAAHLEPEILVVDEVLAVGDAAFQSKCVGKMQDVSKNSGRTVLFVSHNMSAVNALCNHAYYLERGGLVLSGKTADVVAHYLEVAGNRAGNSVLQREPGDVREGIEILQASVDATRNATESSMTDICIRVQYRLHTTQREVRIGFRVDTADGISMVAYNNGGIRDQLPGEYTCQFQVDSIPINEGTYFITLGVDRPPYTSAIFLLNDCLQFHATETVDMPRFPGCLRPRVVHQVEQASHASI